MKRALNIDNKHGSNLIDLLNEVISKEDTSLSSSALFSKMLSKIGIAEAFNPLSEESRSLFSPATIFDAFAPHGSPALRRHFERFFEVVALPCDALKTSLLPGDILFRRAFGEGDLAQLSIIATGRMFGDSELYQDGLIAEGVLNSRYRYAQVIEGGAFPHTYHQKFGRFITDKIGRMPYDQMILRLKHPNLFITEQVDQTEQRRNSFIVESVPNFTIPKRRQIIQPILTPVQNASAIRWNQAKHPSISGIDPADIRAALANYVDFTEVQNTISTYNSAHTDAPIIIGSQPIDAVFAEAAHQFQTKCFFVSSQIDGMAGESTLDSLGTVNRRGLNTVDRVNTKAQRRLNSVATQVSIETSGEFTASNWFQNMVNPSFLGQTFTNGIHLILERKLRIAENHLLTLSSYSGMTPVELGLALNINEIHRGARPTANSRSMHTFGLAVDIMYRGNPWVAGQHVERDASGQPTAAGLVTQTANQNFTQVVNRASLLISGVTVDFTPIYLHSLGANNTGTIYDTLSQRSSDLRAYLQLHGDNAAIQSKLREKRDAGTPGVFDSDSETIAHAAARWESMIDDDLQNLRSPQSNFSGRDPHNGFLNLHRDIVIALRDHAGLAWGAVDLGSRESGDIMHFDCRVDGVGRIILPTSPPIMLTGESGLRNRIVEIAKKEWEYWQQGNLSETDDDAKPLLLKYWMNYRPRRISEKNAEGFVKNRDPWSAVFISYVMREAGARDAFTYSAAHTKYIAAAKKAAGEKDPSKYQAYDISSVRPEVGDLVCRDRSQTKKDPCAGTNFANVDKGGISHCDIVAEANPDQIVILGGNTSQEYPDPGKKRNTVGQRRIKLDSQGHIAPGTAKCKYFAIVKPPGAAIAVLAGTPEPGPTQGAAKPPAELVRFAQRVLNATEGERLDDDGDLGPLTRGALERFRNKYNLGAGGVLDDKTQIALAQRALEELAQQSIFEKGKLDATTIQALSDFKAKRGLGFDAALDVATRAALTDALEQRANAPPSTPIPIVTSSGLPKLGTGLTEHLGTLTIEQPPQFRMSYPFNMKDAEWTAKMLQGEVGDQGGRDTKDNLAVIWAMFNRYALLTHKIKRYPTFADFIRAYSTPLQYSLNSWGAAERHYKNSSFVATGGYYDSPKMPAHLRGKIPRGNLKKHHDLQALAWDQLNPSARAIALRAMRGEAENPIGIASEFASTQQYFKDALRRRGDPVRRPNDQEFVDFTKNYPQRNPKKNFKRWIGPVPGLNQRKNAFFVHNKARDRSGNELPGDTVKVRAP